MITREGPSRFGLPWLAAAVLAAAVTGAQPSWAARYTDPFYVQLLREGEELYERGAMKEAATALRIACFGLLEEPDRLMGGLVHLAAAWSNLGEADAADETLRRILEVETRFEVYRGGELSDAVRDEFEDLLVNRLPYEELRRAPTFLQVWRGSQRESLALLEGRARLERLGALGRRDAACAEWPWLAAEQELVADHAKTAAPWIDRALAIDPLHQQGRCARADLRARQGNCAGMLEDLAGCPAPPDSVAVARSRLRCLVDQKGWDQARELVASLDPRLAADAKVHRLASRLPPVAEPPAGEKPVSAVTAAEHPLGPHASPLPEGREVGIPGLVE